MTTIFAFYSVKRLTRINGKALQSATNSLGTKEVDLSKYLRVLISVRCRWLRWENWSKWTKSGFASKNYGIIWWNGRGWRPIWMLMKNTVMMMMMWRFQDCELFTIWFDSGWWPMSSYQQGSFQRMYCQTRRLCQSLCLLMEVVTIVVRLMLQKESHQKQNQVGENGKRHSRLAWK